LSSTTTQDPLVVSSSDEGTPIKGIEPAQPEPAAEPKPKYSERKLTMTGYDDCGACVNFESFVDNELKPKSDVPTSLTKIIADTEEGKKIVADKKLRVVPYIEECLIPTDPNEKPECREFKKFKKSDFKIKVNS
jgi:hypothetical protein